MQKRAKSLSRKSTGRNNVSKNIKVQRRSLGKSKATVKKSAASKKKTLYRPLAKFNPMPRTVAQIKVALANKRSTSSSSSSVPQYLGFDKYSPPTDSQLTNAFYGNGGVFYYAGFYLAPAPGHSDPGWMNNNTREKLQNIGYGFLIIYFGRQIGKPGLNYEQGQKDADDAMKLTTDAGFTNAGQPVVIYLDVEAGSGTITEAFQQYIIGWVNRVDEVGVLSRPGIYCNHSNADLIHSWFPHINVRFWVVNIKIGCTTDYGSHTVSDCGVSYADTWQYSQDCLHLTPTDWFPAKNKHDGTDLNLSNLQNPSAA